MSQMIGPTGTIRWVITLLTAVCVPLCCCSFDAVFEICKACDGEHAACHASHQGDEALPPLASEHHEPTPPPSTPGKHQEDGGCTCGGDKKIGTVTGKSQLTPPPLVLAYVLPEAAVLQPLHARLGYIRPDSRARLKPAQTLLYQHCALIV